MRGARWWIAVAALAGTMASPATADHEVTVELKNLSGEDKRNWPVVLPVYHVFGRNLPPGSHYYFGAWTRTENVSRHALYLYRTSHPFLGLAHEWGCDHFYNDWQQAMLKHAAALKRVRWVE